MPISTRTPSAAGRGEGKRRKRPSSSANMLAGVIINSSIDAISSSSTTSSTRENTTNTTTTKQSNTFTSTATTTTTTTKVKTATSQFTSSLRKAAREARNLELNSSSIIHNNTSKNFISLLTPHITSSPVERAAASVGDTFLLGSLSLNCPTSAPTAVAAASSCASFRPTNNRNGSNMSSRQHQQHQQQHQRQQHQLSSSSQPVTTTSARFAPSSKISSISDILSAPSLSPPSSSSSLHPFFQKILQDLNEIKKKIPVVAVPDATVREIETSPAQHHKMICEQDRKQKNEERNIETWNLESSEPDDNDNDDDDDDDYYDCRHSSRQPHKPSPPPSQLENGVQEMTCSLFEKGNERGRERRREGRGRSRRGSAQREFSLSQLLALEREHHRQKLDQVWRCAQGWKLRSKEVEASFKNFASNILIEVEMERVSHLEEKRRLELMGVEEKMWMNDVMRPFTLWLLTKAKASSISFAPASSGSARTSCWGTNNKKNSTTKQMEHVSLSTDVPSSSLNSSVLSGSEQTIYRVKDSDLLRALKVAEGRLAELGEPSSKLLTIGTNLTTY